MMGLWSATWFAIEVTLPSILLLGLGVFLRWRNQVNADFCVKASNLVFNYGLPALLFFNLIGNEIHYGTQIRLYVGRINSNNGFIFGC